MKVQILNLEALSVESWFKPTNPVSVPAMEQQPSTSADGFSAARLLCGGVSITADDYDHDEEPSEDLVLSEFIRRANIKHGKGGRPR